MARERQSGDVDPILSMKRVIPNPCVPSGRHPPVGECMTAFASSRRCASAYHLNHRLAKQV